MFYRTLVFLILTVSLSAEDNFWYKPQFMKHSISYLYGNAFQLGEKERELGTLDHYSEWEWGDIYSFIDYTHFDEDNDELYLELKPRFSLSYLLNQRLEFGPVKDIFLATDFNYSNLGGSEAYLAGIGFKFEVPGFKWLNLNCYFREDVKIKGDGTYQLSTDWGIPIELHPKIKLLAEGFTDFAGSSGGSKYNILFSPQLLLDFGNIFGRPEQLYMGTELVYWKNKYGVDNIDEKAWQFIIKYYF